MPVLRPTLILPTTLFLPPILFPPTMPVLRPTLILPPHCGGDSVARGGGMPAGGWGFCSIRSLLSACRRRVAALMVQFPPFGVGEVAVRGGVAPTVHTTSMNNG